MVRERKSMSPELWTHFTSFRPTENTIHNNGRLLFPSSTKRRFFSLFFFDLIKSIEMDYLDTVWSMLCVNRPRPMESWVALAFTLERRLVVFPMELVVDVATEMASTTSSSDAIPSSTTSSTVYSREVGSAETVCSVFSLLSYSSVQHALWPAHVHTLVVLLIFLSFFLLIVFSSFPRAH